MASHLSQTWILLIGIILLQKPALQAQNSAILLSPPAGTLTTSDAWVMKVNLQKDQRVYLLGTIKDFNGKELSKTRSETLRLTAGLNQLTHDNVATSRLDYLNDAIQHSVVSTGNFPPGKYQLCTRVMDANNNQEIDQACLDVEVTEMLKRKGDDGKYKNISLYGSAAVDYIFTNPQPYYRALPASYIRLEAEQGISLYSIPISGSFRYTTEQTDIRQDVNMFSVNFDRNRFERGIKELILRKVAETQLQKVKDNAENLKMLTEHDNLEQLLKDQAVAKIQTELTKLESELKLAVADQTEEARAKYAKLKATYDGLLAKKRQLEKLKQRFDQLVALKENLETSGKLEELKSLVYNPPDLTDPKIIVSYLSKYGAFTGVNKLLFNIKELNIGTAFPVYSPLTLNGTQITGGNFKWNQGLLYVAASGGKMSSAVPFATDSASAAFRQNMAGLSLGVGRTYGSHLSFSTLHFWDQESSLLGTSRPEFFPQSSWVGSSDFMISFGKNRILEFSGEIAGLYKNHNTFDTLGIRLSGLETSINERLKPTIATSVDFAYNGLLAVNLFKNLTKITAGINFVGPGYIHPGVFGLRNDIREQEFRLEQRIAGNKIKIAGLYQFDHDNFSSAKGYTTQSREYGAEFDLSLRHFPQLRLRLTRHELLSPLYFFNSNIANVTLSHQLKISKQTSSNTVINVMYYHTRTDSLGQNLSSQYIFLQQMFSLPQGFTINVGGQYAHNTIGTINNMNTGFSGQIGKTFFKRIRLAIGSTYNAIASDNKLGFTMDVNGMVAKNLQFNLRANRNQYSTYPAAVGRYAENFVQSGIKYTW